MKITFQSLLAFFLFQWHTQAQIRITVQVPQNTAKETPIYLTGNFNNWNPKDENFKLKPEKDGSYSIDFQTTIKFLEFKFTQGSWETVEVNAKNEQIDNRRHLAQESKNLSLKIERWKTGKDAPRKSIVSKNVKVLVEAFEIPQLKRTRKIWVYLPPNYATSEQKYPVLYAHDGQNLFDEATSFSGEWGIDETLDKIFEKNPDKGLIVVGIENGGVHRLTEYTPYKNEKYGGGEGSKYVDFIAKTLKPYVDANFRTLKDAQNTGIIGSSLGGLISFYAGMKYPKVFGKVAVFSPSFWFSKQVYADAKKINSRNKQKWYFLAGGKESATMEADTQKMYELLKKKNFKEYQNILVFRPEGTHKEIFWQAEFESAYRFLFDD